MDMKKVPRKCQKRVSVPYYPAKKDKIQIDQTPVQKENFTIRIIYDVILQKKTLSKHCMTIIIVVVTSKNFHRFKLLSGTGHGYFHIFLTVIFRRRRKSLSFSNLKSSYKRVYG